MGANLSAGLAAELGKLAARISGIEGKVNRLERSQRAAGLGNSSIDNGALTINDASGNPVLMLGLQDDGSFAFNAQGSDVPVAPSPPVLAAGIVEILATWDGNTLTGTTPPADFAAIQVHVSTVSGFTPDNTTLQGTLTSPGTFRIGGSLTAGTVYYVVFVQVNVHGNLSAPSIQSSAIPLSPAAIIGPNQLTAQQLGLPGGVLNPNPYFLGGYGGDYTAVNGIFSVVAAGSGLAPGVAYGYGGQYVNNGISPGYLQENGGQFSVTGGQAYLVTCWANSTDGQLTLGLAWLGGTVAGTLFTQNITVPANTWTQVQIVVTAPAASTGVSGAFAIAGLPGSSGGTLQVAGLLCLQSLPGGLVQAGTVTAAQIAAGTIVAGIINGTVVNAATFNGSVFNGTNWTNNALGSLYYSSAPAFGTLDISLSPNGGTDAFGNVFPQGIAVGAIGSTSGSVIQMDQTGFTFKNVHNAGGGLFPTTTVTIQGNPSTDIVDLTATPSGGGTGTFRFNGNMEFVSAPQLDSGAVLGSIATPSAPSSGTTAYSDSGNVPRARTALDNQVYAFGHLLVQNTAGTTVNTGGAYGTVATATVGTGTYRMRGQISYSTSVGSPTGSPRVRFDIGTATQGHTRGAFYNAGTPTVIDKGLTSSDTFAGNTLTASAQIMEFDFVMPFTASGTFLVSCASTGSTYTVNFVNLHVEPV